MRGTSPHGCNGGACRVASGIRHDLFRESLVKNGVLDRVFEQQELIRLEAVSLDSTIVKAHPDGTGALKKTVHRQIPRRPPRYAADARTNKLAPHALGTARRMDRAYQGDETRQLALDLGLPVVPPVATRVDPWEYDRELYKRRNEIERLFRRLKGYRRIFSRFDKHALFLGFIHFALIFDRRP